MCKDGLCDHTEQHEHHTHNHHTDHMKTSLNKTTSMATFHCLTGCAIGEVLGMIIGTALGWEILPTMALAILLAFAFGYTLSARSLTKNGLPWKQAFKVALVADTLSITIMEIADNGFILLLPGASEAHLNHPYFWISLSLALVVAYIAAWPVNRWLIARGKGHALSHQFHR